MSKYIITSDNKITNKQVIIINGDHTCELVENELIIYNALKLKPFISINTTILINFKNNLYLIPDFVLICMRNDTVDSNLTLTYLIYCSYNDFMNKVKDNKIDLNDFNSLFKNKLDDDTVNESECEEESVIENTDSIEKTDEIEDDNNEFVEDNQSVCYCVIM